MKTLLTVGAFLGVLATPLSAQMQMPKPGPEQARIGYFAGQWTMEGEAKPGPMGPGGKFTDNSTCDWFAGGFHLVCRSEGVSPMGAATGQAIMGYDPMEKTYTYYYISSVGEGFFVRGSVSGKVWTWNMETKFEEKVAKMKVTITEESPTSYGFVMEASFDGGPWAVISEAKATKK